MQKIEI